MIDKDTLPKGWEIKKLGEVCETTSGGTPSRKQPEYYNGEIPWVKSGELDRGLIIDTEEKITEEAVKNSSAKIFPKGTLLIALYGATIGKLAFLGINAATNQAICGIFKNENIESKYLFHFLFYKKPTLVKQGIGGAQPNISQGILKNLEVPLPPLPIQQKIVAKIEELLSELDKGKEQLEIAKAQLKIYRQAVLKWTFEGKLTSNKVPQAGIEPSVPGVGLELNGSDPGEARTFNLHKDNNYAMVAEPEVAYKKKTQKKVIPTGLEPSPSVDRRGIEPLLPEGWKWVNLGDITAKIQIGPFGTQLHKEDYIEGGIPLINPMHIIDNKVVADYSYSITEEKKNSLPNYILKEGDIIMGRRGEMGRCGLIKAKENGWFCGTGSLYVRPNSKIANSLFLYFLLKSDPIKKYLEDNAGGTTMANLNLKIVKEIPLGLPPLAEQNFIVQEIESRLSVCDKVEETINNSLQQAETLRQSILKKAFEGKLVIELKT